MPAAIVVVCVLSVGATAQQQPACKSVVAPTMIFFKDGKPVPGVEAKSLKARIGHSPAEITAAALDTSPRRILLIVENGKNVSKDAWRVAMTMTNTIVVNARPTDSFALLTYGAGKEALPFAATNDGVRDKLAAMDTARPPFDPKAPEMGLYDALLEGLAIFGRPQFGDAILLFTASPSDRGHADVHKVEQALLARGTRLIALSLSQRELPGIRDTVLIYTPKDEIATGFNTDELRVLSRETGGLFYLEDTQPAKSAYTLTDAHVKELMKQAMQMYIIAARVYRVEVAAPASARLESLELQPGDALRKQASQIVIIYPTQIAACGYVAQ